MDYLVRLELSDEMVRELTSDGLEELDYVMTKLAHRYYTNQMGVDKVVRDFAKACLVKGIDRRIRAAEVYQMYLQWCNFHDTAALGRNTFYDSLIALDGVSKTRIANAVIIRGIGRDATKRIGECTT